MLSAGKYLPGLALVLDTLIGDPRTGWHPVVLIGGLIAALEKRLLRPDATPAAKRWAGLVLVAAALAVSYAAAWLAVAALAALHPLAGLGGGALLLSFAVSPRSLAAAGREIQACLEAGDLETARAKVGWIVGRDTDRLDVAEVTRARRDSRRKHHRRHRRAPFLRRPRRRAPRHPLPDRHTLDSMVGYKNDKYRDFGLVAARTDDAFNYIPARITGLLVVAAAFLLRHDARGAARAIWRDAGRHPSPNSGFPEAGVAGALGIRLGGLNYYGGVPSLRATMGEPRRELAPGHIAAAIRIMYTVTALAAALATVLSL
jgi:adenosylcobinamide-phosphate synthase